MGYSYGYNANGRYVLSCDGCGNLGGVRKRTCPHRVHYADGGSAPYCQPAALCKACYAKHKATLHAECAEGARLANEREVRRGRMLVAGEAEVRTAWGDWHANVPEGFVGVRFVGRDGETFRLVRKDDYDPAGKHWLSNYPDALPWEDPDRPTTKYDPSLIDVVRKANEAVQA